MNFKEFNNKDTVLVISGWPETSGSKQNNYGIAWYTKETIEPIAKAYNQRFIVLCETNHNNRPKLVSGGKILILRVFDQKHKSLYPKILKWLTTFRKVNRVFVHSEFCTNGGIKNFVLLIPFLLLIRLTGKKITYFAHNVITDLTVIAPHLNYDTNSLKFKILNRGLSYYYKMLGLLCTRIVVMDDEMKTRLLRYMPSEKVISIPFWIKEEPKIKKASARKRLGIPANKFILLYFGFVTWYKGADWLIKKIKNSDFSKRHPNTQLIIAGGEAYSLKDEAHYQKYYNEQKNEAKNSNNITLTGFVDESDVPLYFSAADVAIFPYRGLIGSSGAMSQAIANGKPFVMSNKMRGGLNNSTYQNALANAGLKEKEIVFSHDKDSFEKIIDSLFNNNKLKKLSKVSEEIKDRRSFSLQLPIYWELIFCDIEDPLVRLDNAFIHGAYQTVNQ